MEYSELRNIFYEHERTCPAEHLTVHIVFTEDSFPQRYPLESRTYVVSSDNKAFQADMGGYSIFGSSLDGKDMYVRLEAYMRAEHGGKHGWVVENCHLLKMASDNERGM